MDDWATIASFATAVGTLVLAVATFWSVRSANRSARIAERSFQIGLRPILASSRPEDPAQRIMFADRHWVDLQGGRGAAEFSDDNLYLAMSVRNVGNGIAVIEAWQPFAEQLTGEGGWGDLEDFRPQTRALWVPPGDVAFWQGAIRDPEESLYGPLREAVADGALTIDLLYRDDEGGQRMVSRFSMIRREDDGDGAAWWTSLARHHTLEPD